MDTLIRERLAALGVTIKYKGLEDGPILLTPEGRFTPTDASAEPKSPSPAFLNTRGSDMRIAVRQIEQERVLAEVKQRIDYLASTLDNLHVPASDVVQAERTAVSPQPGAVSAEADQQATAPATHSVEVRWPARVRTVYSEPVNPVEDVGQSDGAHSLILNIEGTDYTVNLDVNNGSTVDTNEDLLRRMARAIDQVDSRVSAQVEYVYTDAYDATPRSRPMNRMLRLVVTSTEGGQGTDFYLSDDGSDTLASDFGIEAAAPRRAARVVLRGALRDQSSNTLSLDNGHVIGEAKAMTDGTAQVQVSQGVGVISGELQQVLDQYNGLVSYLDQHSDLLRSSLKDRIVRPLEERARSMPSLGLYPRAGGRLTAGSNLDQRLEANFAAARETLFAEGGWTDALSQKLDQIQGMELTAFAAPLDNDFEAQRRRMWEAVGEVAFSIVSGYY